MTASKIMIVDNDKEYLEKLQKIVAVSGYNTIAINDSTVALQAIHKTKPDVILLDIKMKGKYRFHLAESLRRSLKNTHISIIAMCNFFPRKEDSMLMGLCGIETCLHKPLNPLDVIFAIENVLSKKLNKQRKKRRLALIKG